MCGDNPRLADCGASQSAIATDAALLASFPSSQTFERVSCSRRFPGCTRTSCKIVATEPVNVIDIDSLSLGEDCELVLDGRDIPGAVFVVRVARKFRTLAKASVSLTGGVLAENVLFAVRARRCEIGVNNRGSGTIFCPEARVRLKGRTEWTGAAVSGGGRAELGANAVLTHRPFLGLAGPAPEIQPWLRAVD